MLIKFLFNLMGAVQQPNVYVLENNVEHLQYNLIKGTIQHVMM